MSDIVLISFPARYAHSPFAAYTLKANLGPLASRCVVLEPGLDANPEDVVEQILAQAPRLAGFCVYIWNVEAVAATLDVLRTVAPDVLRVVGGPQIVAGDAARPPVQALADVAVMGEAEVVFRDVCEQWLDSGRRPTASFLVAEAPDPEALNLPYAEYPIETLSSRVVYAETARGCPLSCAYCSSASSRGLRRIAPDRFFASLDPLIERGARNIKLLDRSFNADPDHALAVLAGFERRVEEHPGLRLHLEWVPEWLSDDLLKALSLFPRGSLQLELGVQTLDPAVAARVDRRIDPERVLDNLRRLRASTSAELHFDLIVGLPGEDVTSFARGFDILAALRPDALQVNLLKCLPGTPLAARATELGLRFSPRPPYALLCSADLDFNERMWLQRMAQIWDRVVNRGHFPAAAEAWCHAPSPFARAMSFSRTVFRRFGRTYAIARSRLAEALTEFEERVRNEQNVS